MKLTTHAPSQGILIINNEGLIVFANLMISQLFGYATEELIGQSIEQILPNGLVLLKSSIREDVKRTRVKGVKKDKSMIPVEIKSESFHNEKETLNIIFFSIKGKVSMNEKEEPFQSNILSSSVANSKIIKDLQLQIQKRKDIEKRLVNIQRLYDTVVHNFPDGVIGVLNRDMQYVLVDGKELNEINLPSLGLSYLKRKEGTTNLADREILNKIKNVFDGNHVEFEIENEGRFYNVSCVPLPDISNHINEILFVIKNITERKRMEEGLLKALEKEKELGELKSRFVTMASHEFKTPLAMILSSAFLLENFKAADYEKEKKEHTNRITRSVNNLTMIINEILAIEKLEENLVKVTNTKLNIPTLFKDFISEIELTKREGQNIEYRHNGKQHSAYLDKNLLWSILTNLISNGLKYSKNGDTIHITSEIKNKLLTLEVQDDGIGIPTEEQEHVFERFFRARNVVNIEGTGLGLHIVEKNIKLMKGSIQFSSQVNVGTKFTVIIPDGSSA